MTTETAQAADSSSIVKGDPTSDVSEAVVPENAIKSDDYKEWLDEAANICGQEMKGDIDPVSKQAVNLGPVADNLAGQLGLEDMSHAEALISAEEEAELNKMDEESRQFNFTAEDVGVCTSTDSYTPALENAWFNIETFKTNVERLDLHGKEADELIMAIESAGTIDYDTALKLKERIPGSLDNVNIKMFTKLPSRVGYQMAREGSLAGKVIIGGLIIAGSIYLIYKILTWTIDGIKVTAKIIKRIRERRSNYKRTHDKVGDETFNPEDIDLDKMAKALFDEPTVEVKAKMKAVGKQPLELRNIKWTATKDFSKLITPLMVRHLDDIDGSRIERMNLLLEGLVDKVQESVEFTKAIMDGIIASPGNELNAAIIAEGLNRELAYVNEFIEDLKVPITFSNNSNIERLKAIYEWLDDSIKPDVGVALHNAPSVKFVSALGDIRFKALNDEFAEQITTIRETLNPKGKKTIVAADTLEQADTRKEIIKDITVTFMALSNMIRSIYHYTLYIESIIVAEDQFINQVKKFTA